MSRSEQTFEVNSWTDVGVDAIQTPELNSDQRAKFVVIGAGYSGVAAARRLATLHPDSEIVLLESEWFGDGSSSRSSGFVVSLGQFERPGSPENQRCYRFGKTAIEVLRELVQHHQIDCDWLDQGRIVTCRCRSGARSLERMEHVLKQLGSPFEKLDGAAIHEETGMSGYVFGIRQADSVLVNPAKLLVGLVKALPSNVSVYQDASVRSLTRKSNGRGVLVKTEAVTLEAENVLITSNAFSLLLGHGQHRVFPMRTFVSVAKLNGGNGLGSDPDWGITSSERVGSSLRRVNDRVFIRNSAYYGYHSSGGRLDNLAQISGFQRRSIQRRFPGADVAIENTWSGVIGITANGGQLFGQVGDGIYLSTGYNGHGIAQGTRSGELLADLASGKQSNDLQEIMKIRKPNWLPIGFPLRMGVAAYCRYLEWRYRDEI